MEKETGKAVFMDGCVRCDKCGVEIWEDCEPCDCGYENWYNLDEAYINKE